MTLGALHWPGWRHLPRDARDTLFLLAVIAWTVVPHVGHIPPWCSLLTAAVLAWRAQMALSGAALPGRWVLAGFLLLAGLLTLWSFRTLLGKEPGVTLAVVLMALKTLELRARRDAFVVFFLGFFLILTNFLYSQSLPVAAAMLISVWGLLTALVLAHMPVGQPALRHAGGLAVRTALLGAPIMALLFVLFPRLGPLWSVPQDDTARTGLSNSMRMGSVAEIAQDDSIALRLRFLDRVPPPSAMYFRGPVLSTYDGREWRPLANVRERLPELRVSDSPLAYEMTLEPSRLSALPLLEASAAFPRLEGYGVARREDLQWSTDRPLASRVIVSAQANLDFRHGPANWNNSLRRYIDLPAGYSPRTLEWAAALRRDPRYAQADARTLAQALYTRIRTGGYSYTLAPGTYGEQDPRAALDEFWLDRKEGFCEHFAAAFVVIMRALDVPARVVTGYQGTDPLPVDGFYVVRQSSAHAWAEYWQPGEGWVRADPTAVVAPDRISRSSRLAPAPGLVAGAIGSMSPQMLARLRETWETVNNRWNQWVLNYTRGQQLDLLKKIGFESPRWEDLAFLLIATISSLALVGALWAWWDRRRVDPWVRQMERVGDALRELGLAVSPHDPPRALAHRVRGALGTPGEPLASLLESLDRQRYSRNAQRNPNAGTTKLITSQVRALKTATRQIARPLHGTPS